MLFVAQIALACLTSLVTPADSLPALGLPVIEVPHDGKGSTLAVILSGDGGWAAGDKAMAAALAHKGMAVVGLDVPSYLRDTRTPDVAGADLTRLLRHYLDAWNRSRVILVGYSHGADLVPFMASRLPPDLRNRIDLIAMLSLEPRASFEFHVEDLVAQVTHDDALPVLPEVEKLRGMPMLCVMGTEEKHSLCASVPPSLATTVLRRGGHRISGRDGSAAADLVIAALTSPRRP